MVTSGRERSCSLDMNFLTVNIVVQHQEEEALQVKLSKLHNSILHYFTVKLTNNNYIINIIM